MQIDEIFVLSIVPILYFSNLYLLIKSYNKKKDIFASGFAGVLFVVFFIFASIYTFTYITILIGYENGEAFMGHALIMLPMIIILSITVIYQYLYLKDK